MGPLWTYVQAVHCQNHELFHSGYKETQKLNETIGYCGKWKPLVGNDWSCQMLDGCHI